MSIPSLRQYIFTVIVFCRYINYDVNFDCLHKQERSDIISKFPNHIKKKMTSVNSSLSGKVSTQLHTVVAKMGGGGNSLACQTLNLQYTVWSKSMHIIVHTTYVKIFMASCTKHHYMSPLDLRVSMQQLTSMHLHHCHFFLFLGLRNHHGQQ